MDNRVYLNMKNLLLVLLVMLLTFSCGNRKNEFSNSKQDTICDFKIVSLDYLDYHPDILQRVFVEIDSTNIYNLSCIDEVILQLKKCCMISPNTNISFFSDYSYAKYLHEIIEEMSDDEEISRFVDLWKNNYYLAEYKFIDSSFVVYPRNEEKKKKLR